MKGVMQKVQRFGGAMFTPVLLFSFAGIMVGLSTLFMNQSIFGHSRQKRESGIRFGI